MTKTENFRKRLQGPPILADGAMGTVLYTRGVYVNRCFDELNLVQPELVLSVHEDYLKAGAELIETNSYGANRYKLNPHGLIDKVIEINRASVKVAQEAIIKSGRDAFIAGSMGPLGKPLAPLGLIEPCDARDAFADQARGLIEGGVDLISVETMINPAELIVAIEAIRNQSDVPIMAQFTLSDWNETYLGATLEGIVAKLNRLDVDAIGINCSIGPSKLLEAAKLLRETTDKPIAIQPNAGELEWVEGRLITKATPEYFAEYAKRMVLSGVNIIGGCCGSTPEYTRTMNAAIRAVVPELSKVVIPTTVPQPEQPKEKVKVTPYHDLSPMSKALDSGEFVFSVEIHPPRSPAVKRVTDGVRKLRDAGVTLVNIPDGPRASARLSAMVLGTLIQQRVPGMDAIVHYTCRDRNILGMQSDLLGAEALGINNILCVTGDPPKLGDYPMATAVYDVDAIGLLRIGDNLNHSTDLIGNPIPRGTSFHLGCGANPGAVDLELEIDRLHRKIESGARFVLTQPVFDEEVYFKFLDKANIRKIPFLVGILPLANYRNAEFFHNEVPGMEVPQPIRDRLKPIEDRETAAQVGVEIAAESLIKCASRSAGAYIMPPFGKAERALEVIEIFRSYSKSSKLGCL